ncbi:MAG: hypothetical protein QGH70_01560, partial [Nitrospinota bacterium]|nr:hypothetical protein [Nitrospinota bacterium]
ALLPGDNVVEDWPPLLHSGVAAAWQDTLDFIEGMEIDVICPGHGAISDKSVLAVLRKDIQDLIAMVQKAVDDGKTKEQAEEMKDYFYQVLGGKGIGGIYDVLNPPPKEEKPKKKRKPLVNKGE